ncbi:hypothetical protein ACWC3X_44310 [Streptomyces populi]
MPRPTAITTPWWTSRAACRRLGEWWSLQLEHDSETSLSRAELVRALTDPHHGLPLELCGHRGLIPEEASAWCS